MSDSFRALISDTLTFLKDPLLPKQTYFVLGEEISFFKPQALPEREIPIDKPDIALPKIFIAPERPQKKTIAPPPPAPKEAPLKSEPPKSKASSDQIKTALLRVAPHMKLVDEVPDDAIATKRATAWKQRFPDTEVILLACQADGETLEFLKNLGKAIDQNLAKTKILSADNLEKENRWDLFLQQNSFRLIVTSDGMQQFPALLRFYNGAYLDKIPLLALGPASLYKQLEHKALLWKTLCQMLKK